MSGSRISVSEPVPSQDQNQPQVVFTRQLWQRSAPDDSDTNTAASPTRARGTRRPSASAESRTTRIDSVVPPMSSPTRQSPLSPSDFERLAIAGSPRKRTHDVDYFAALLCPPAGNEHVPLCTCQKIPRPRNAFILYRQYCHVLITAQEPSLTNPEISKLVGERWKLEPQHVKNEWMAKAELEKREHARKYPDYRYQPRRGGKEQGPSRIVICPVCQGRKVASIPSPNAPQVETPGGTDSEGASGSRRSKNISIGSASAMQAHVTELPTHHVASRETLLAGPPQQPVDNKRRRTESHTARPPSTSFTHVGDASTNSTTLPPMSRDHRAGTPPPIDLQRSNASAAPSNALPPISTLIDSPLDACPVTLAPMTQRSSFEPATDSMRRLQNKVRLFQGTLQSAGRPTPHERRAPIVAVEGDNGAASRDVADWLAETLDDIGTNVMSCNGPRLPDTRAIGRGDLRNTAATWLQRSGDVFRQALASAPSNSSTQNEDNDDDMSRTAMILFRSYVLGASDLFAQHLRRIPGAPDEAMLWQYMAEEWRGVIAPDLLIYIKDAEEDEDGDMATVARFDGGNVLVVWRKTSQGTNAQRRFSGIKKDAMLRLNLDVQIWLRAFYRAQRD